jgi:hypothetical protein
VSQHTAAFFEGKIQIEVLKTTKIHILVIDFYKNKIQNVGIITV